MNMTPKEYIEALCDEIDTIIDMCATNKTTKEDADKTLSAAWVSLCVVESMLRVFVKTEYGSEEDKNEND